MARLHEYQGKAILAANGFKIPRGRAALTPDDAVTAARELEVGKKGAEVVIKIQAWTTGRAGLGGVAFAKRPDDVRGHAARMLEIQTREKPMRRIDPVKHGYGGPPPRGISDGNPKSQDPKPKEKGEPR